MSRNYTPRRCSSRWLDADCPPEVLCIVAWRFSGGYDIVYTEVHTSRLRSWLIGISLRSTGFVLNNFESDVDVVAEWRYRNKHRYATWSSLPDAVKKTVRDDIASMKTASA